VWFDLFGPVKSSHFFIHSIVAASFSKTTTILARAESACHALSRRLRDVEVSDVTAELRRSFDLSSRLARALAAAVGVCHHVRDGGFDFAVAGILLDKREVVYSWWRDIARKSTTSKCEVAASAPPTDCWAQKQS
jgi:hypothetical protein